MLLNSVQNRLVYHLISSNDDHLELKIFKEIKSVDINMISTKKKVHIKTRGDNKEVIVKYNLLKTQVSHNYESYVQKFH